TTGTLSLKEVLALARRHKVSMTEYLTATLMYVLYVMQLSEHPKRKQLPVKISVPVNLRKYYPTKTLRNFSQYLNPGIDPGLGDFTFEETLEQVHHYFRYMFTEKNLNARMSQNVDAASHPAVRAIPLIIKKVALRLVFELVGERVFSTVISNVGAFTAPDVMLDQVERFDLLLNTALHNTVECGVASLNDTLSISFTRHISEPYVERMFFRRLVQQGLHVKVESNSY
ncbi:alcohol acetyltransferase, partial [Eubacteriales bacterium OttesenSCG-928-K08]|nr:alcohol acetyltransferase [Eubacteriales bacterium OttesenSCG-928-K08]